MKRDQRCRHDDAAGLQDHLVRRHRLLDHHPVPVPSKSKEKFGSPVSIWSPGKGHSRICWTMFVRNPGCLRVDRLSRILGSPFHPRDWLAWTTRTLRGIMAIFQSHADLGKNWSISLEVRERHALVQTGIYRFIRHPMYASFFVLALAQFLLLPNWGAGAAGLVGVSVLYAFRVQNEERLMHETFGGDYIQYMTKTKRLIPWIF
jgi:protein-S-isoprenylcysteine O-methyltransferase Ste14